MILQWWRKYRRRRLSAQPFPDDWRQVLRDHLPLYRTLTGDERAALESAGRILVAEKYWEGCGGLILTDRMKILIAAQAALLVLHLKHDYYRRVSTVLVYPDTFITHSTQTGPGGMVSETTSPTLGQAVSTGTVVLAWAAVVEGAADPHDGRNVVFHEFAHKLDMLDGFVDGTPPLGDRRQYEAWQRIMTEHYEELRADVEAGRQTFLDAYGASNPAEFFAVTTEYFFELPTSLKRRHPDLYRLLSSFYRQDPVARHQKVIGDAARQSLLSPREPL